MKKTGEMIFVLEPTPYYPQSIATLPDARIVISRSFTGQIIIDGPFAEVADFFLQ
jgi:hypothetical protein